MTSELWLNRFPAAHADPLKIEAGIRMSEATHGEKNLKVAIRLNNLGLLLYNMGRKAEAEPLVRRALAIVEDEPGPNHPNAKNVRKNLQFLLQMIQGTDD